MSESGNPCVRFINNNETHICSSLSIFSFVLFISNHFSLLFHCLFLSLVLPAPLPSMFAIALPSSGAQGAWSLSDVAPVPLLSSPDLDALCDPAAPALSASLPRSSASCSAPLSTTGSVSSLQPQLPASPSAVPTQGSSSESSRPAKHTDVLLCTFQRLDISCAIVFWFCRLNGPCHPSRERNTQRSGQNIQPAIQIRPGFKGGPCTKQR